MSAVDPFPCRSCRRPVQRLVLDLGLMPLANAYRDPLDVGPEQRHPLRLVLCDTCFLAQLDHQVPAAEIFTDYAYFSSFSESWLEHARSFCGWAVSALDLDSTSLVVEVASNDGYLLQNFVHVGIPVLGVEPAGNVAAVARAAGVRTEELFFGKDAATDLRRRHGAADLIAANNVLAHVPDLDDFIAGVAVLLADQGVFSVEFPHLLNLLQEGQFDTIYHEHYSYLSLLALESAFGRNGLRVWDVERLPTHGGSLRLLVAHHSSARAEAPAVAQLRHMEAAAGLHLPGAYQTFAQSVEACRTSLRDFLAQAASNGSSVVGYGAAAKGNTLLNYCGVTPRELPFVVDRSPHKQGRLLPGSGIPVRPVEDLAVHEPDFVLILPWNLRAEIMDQMAAVRSWGGRFVTPVPVTRVLP